MIGLKLIDHDFAYEVMDIMKMFYGKEEIKVSNSSGILENEALAKGQSFFPDGHEMQDCREWIRSTYYHSEAVAFFRAELFLENRIIGCVEQKLTCNILKDKRLMKRNLKISIYRLLSEHYKKTYPWGILSGIRPVKIVHDYLDSNLSEAEIISRMQKDYLVNQDRAELALSIAKRERKFLQPIRRDRVSVYVGIPFCPSRCFYCSFTSNTIGSCKNLVPEYLDALVFEIKETSKFLKEQGIIVQTIYIGGGTPTSIDEAQLDYLLTNIKACFGGDYEELTCEAGRPDTITEGKLAVMKKHGVTRLSINPQTMNDETLLRIGRAHNKALTLESFKLARSYGFNNINMDIILGLPGEGMAELQNTLDEIGGLSPENVTVHAMAIKRASIFNENSELVKIAGDDEISAMMDQTKAFLGSMDMHPYYLYRQKHMVQNMENIGFCKPGFEGIYNIQIIEEKQSIVAFGADAATKVVFFDENRIERQHNIKDLRLYIKNIDKMIEDKISLLREYVDKNIDT